MHICSSSEYSSESRIPIINNPDEKTIYLVPASYQPSNNMFTEWVYINNTWEIFGSVAVDLSNYLTDVQIDGTSVVSDGVASIPKAASATLGLVSLQSDYGVFGSGATNRLTITQATTSNIKNGTTDFKPIVPSKQHESVFYGLAKVAGYDEKNSALPVGTYSEEAKTAIQNMLDVPSTSDVQSLQTAVQSKADAQMVTALSGTVTGLQTTKADKSYVDTELASKASTATATASADGLMSAQDKSRLDTVYADYSSALTALGVIE